MFLSTHQEDIYWDYPLVLLISQHKEHSGATDSLWLHFLFTRFPSSEKPPSPLAENCPSDSSPFSMNLLLVSRILGPTPSGNVEHIKARISQAGFSVLPSLSRAGPLFIYQCVPGT